MKCYECIALASDFLGLIYYAEAIHNLHIKQALKELGY